MVEVKKFQNIFRYNTIGVEVKAVTKVLESGVLSDFIGAPGEYFLD